MEEQGTGEKKVTVAKEPAEAKELTGEAPPRPVMVWVGGTIAYGLMVLLAGLVLTGINPESSVFPPLLTALAGLFVATAINVRPGAAEEAGAEWNRFQTHAIVVAITSMVLSMGLVMCALAFPGELIYRLAFWGSAIAILIGASFLLATVWQRLRSDESALAPEKGPEPAPEPEPDPASVDETGLESDVAAEPRATKPKAPKPKAEKTEKKKAAKKELRRAPQAALVAETLEKSKKPKKPGKKKPKKKDEKKKK